MNIPVILSKINHKLAGEMLRETDLLSYMDKVVVDINNRLQARFPTFTEAKSLPGFNGDYNFFPDRYILGVVIPGSAYYFYTDEEEGERVASTFESEYASGLFVMSRDFLSQVPEIFQNTSGGFLDMDWPKSRENSKFFEDVFVSGGGSYHDAAENQLLKERIARLEALLGVVPDDPTT